MRTIVDIASETCGTNPVAMYVSPGYDATLAHAVQHPTSDQRRIHHLLIIFHRSAAPPSNPCLIIASETPEGAGQPVLGVYDDSSHQILRQEQGDWADIAAFGRRAVELASQRLGTTFTEHRGRRTGAR